jgi:hypothetical protein
MPKGLSAVILTFCNKMLVAGASGKPQIKPALLPGATLASREGNHAGAFGTLGFGERPPGNALPINDAWPCKCLCESGYPLILW